MRFLLIFLLSIPAWATTQFIGGASNGNVSASANRFFGIMGLNTVQTSTGAAQQIMPDGGTFSSFCVVLSGAPGTASSGKSYDISVEKNGTPGALTVNILDTATTSCDHTHSMSFVATDTISIKTVPNSTPTAVQVYVSAFFVPTTTNTSVILGPPNSSNMGTVAANYAKISGMAATVWDATETNRHTLISAAGSITKMYVVLSGAAGGTSYVFTLYQNAAPTGITCTVTTAQTACNDTGHTVTVTAGDNFSVEEVPNGTPTARSAAIGFAFVSTTAGESPLSGGTTGAWSTTVVNYTGDNGGTPSGTEATFHIVGQATVVIKKFYMALATAPGAAASGKKYTFRSRKNVNNGGLSFDILETATTGNDTSNFDTLADFDLINISGTPTSNPTAPGVTAWGLVAFIAPTATQRHVIVVNQ